MNITFDPAKREATLVNRNLDFARAMEVFRGATVTREDKRFAYSESRFITAGDLDDQLVVVVWTPIPGGRRIISMRRTHARESRKWREQMG